MKIAIELLTGYEWEDARTVRKLAEAALSQGHEVSIFLMDDGVYQAASLADLAERGAHLAVCAHNCLQRTVDKVGGVLWGSQYDWAEMVAESDRVIAFG